MMASSAGTSLPAAAEYYAEREKYKSQWETTTIQSLQKLLKSLKNLDLQGFNVYSFDLIC